MRKLFISLILIVILGLPAMAELQPNAKTRIRTAVAAADVADPTTSSTFANTQGESYIEVTVNFNTSATGCTIQPWFLEEKVYTTLGAVVSSYVSSGSPIALTKTGGSTVIIPGVNGRKVFIQVDSITGAGTVDIDLGAGKVGPGVNAI